MIAGFSSAAEKAHNASVHSARQSASDAPLAISGGEPVRKKPMPTRTALGAQEEAIIKEVIEYYRERRLDPGYQGEFEKREEL